jgi:hypothetical protein
MFFEIWGELTKLALVGPVGSHHPAKDLSEESHIKSLRELTMLAMSHKHFQVHEEYRQ